MVTHMDSVDWSEAFCSKKIDDELGIETVLYSSSMKEGKNILSDILRVCTSKHNLSVDEENFLKIFKIDNNNVKIIRTTKKIVKDYENLIKAFEGMQGTYDPKTRLDLMFEFQAFMTEEITRAQQRISAEHGFGFEPTTEGYNQVGQGISVHVIVN